MVEISSTSINTSVSSKFNSGEVAWFALLIPARSFDWSWTLKGGKQNIYNRGDIQSGTCCFSIWIESFFSWNWFHEKCSVRTQGLYILPIEMLFQISSLRKPLIAVITFVIFCAFMNCNNVPFQIKRLGKYFWAEMALVNF